MKNKLTVAVDIDGILRNFDGQLRKIYKKYYPNHIIPPITLEWDLDKTYPIGKKIYKFVYNEHPEEIWLYAKPYKGALEFVKQLAKLKSYIKLIILSCQPYNNVKKLTLKWLENWGFKDYFDDIIFECKKHLVKFDILIDDSPKVIKKVSEVGKQVVIFNRPWNYNIKGKRVYSYEEFINIIKKMVGVNE